MPIPGLTDIYAFGDWLKQNYRGEARRPLLVTPVKGGLIRVGELKEETHNGNENPQEGTRTSIPLRS